MKRDKTIFTETITMVLKISTVMVLVALEVILEKDVN
jgi:hypothetical protein